MTILEPRLIDPIDNVTDYDHYGCCHDIPDEPTLTLCGQVDVFDGEHVDEVNCPVCMLAYDMRICPRYGKCREAA